MTTQLTVLVDSSEDLAAVVDAVEFCIGKKLEWLQDEQNGRYYARNMLVEFVAYTNHEFVDDCGIEFSKFRHVVGFRPLRAAPDLTTYDAMYAAIVEFVAYTISDRVGCNVLVVAELQHKVVEYSGGRLHRRYSNSTALARS